MAPFRRVVGEALHAGMNSRSFVRLLNTVGRGGCLVLVLHRFAHPDLGIPGHEPEALRQVLAALRRFRVPVLDLEEALGTLEAGVTGTSHQRLSVAITIDDGYRDLVDVAAPIFREFDCPVSGFVVPRAVTGDVWFWWDQLDWILRNSVRRGLQAEVAGEPLNVAWHDEPTRINAREAIEERVKCVRHDELERVIAELAAQAEVAIPENAPAEYAVLTWSDLRDAEGRGMRFGAHSMSHPILSRCSDERATYEIVESVRAVESELTRAVPLFCYPNGKDGDFGLREEAALHAVGYRYALSTIPGILRPDVPRVMGDRWRLRVPRIPYEENLGRILRNFL